MTGDIRWNFPMRLGSAAAGVLGTAGGVVFASDPEGSLIALDARTGAKLWHYQTGGEIRSSPISYAVDGQAVRGDRGGLDAVCVWAAVNAKARR